MSKIASDITNRGGSDNLCTTEERPVGGACSRREFLRTGARVAAVGVLGGFPTIIPSSVLGAEAPSNQVHLAGIGVGGRGSGILGAAAGQPQTKVVAVCDVLQARREQAAASYNRHYKDEVCTPYRDLREMLARDDIDAVTIGTPDHWHVPAALLAVRAGKDVYVEKPLGISMEENVGHSPRGQPLRPHLPVRHAAALDGPRPLRLRAGAQRTARQDPVGRGDRAELRLRGRDRSSRSPCPEGLDYDLWLGPAPWRPYTKDRCTAGAPIGAPTTPTGSSAAGAPIR